MKIVIAPDSFKGTLSAREVCEAAGEAFAAAAPESEIIKIPLADGGEGLTDALGAKRIAATVTGPNFTPIESFFGLLNESAVIELAAAAGLPAAEPKDPEATTTFGVGELIKAALDYGCRRFIVGLGGSATNDCGAGLAAALGVRFIGRTGEFVPAGGSLHEIEAIDMSGLDSRIKDCRFSVMCDVDNPLYGKEGAAYIFAPQKGADVDAVTRLDAGLRHISEIISRDCGKDVSSLRGAGAAGGAGAGLVAFLGGELKRGIDAVLDETGFDAALSGASLVITGEGKFDSQSMGGKVVSGVAARTKRAGTPLVVIAGAAEEPPECYGAGVSAVFSIARKSLPLAEALPRNRQDVYSTVYNIAKLISALFT